MGQHDLSYRLFFSHRLMVQALLWRFIDKYWFERVDFDSGKVVDTTLISPQHENHESDLLWRFWRKDGGAPVFLYILMEPQPEPDPSLPDRFMKRFGHLSPEAEEQVRSTDVDRLLEWSDRVLTAERLQDVFGD